MNRLTSFTTQARLQRSFISKLLNDTNIKIKRQFAESTIDGRLEPLRKDFSFFDRENKLPFIDYASSVPRVIGETSSKWNSGTLLCVSHGNGWRTLQFGEKPKYVQSGVRCIRENISNPEDVILLILALMNSAKWMVDTLHALIYVQWVLLDFLSLNTYKKEHLKIPG